MREVLAEIQKKPRLAEKYEDRFNSPIRLNLTAAAKRGSLTKKELVEIVKVKSHRTIKLLERDEKVIEQVTRSAFDALLKGMPDSAIKKLEVLSGVGVPIASAILSWVFPNSAAVIDVHATRTLKELAGIEIGRGACDYAKYVRLTRQIACKCGETPQWVDRWLYSYSKSELGRL